MAATFNKVLTTEEWGKVLDLNRKVHAETGTPLIDVNLLNVARKAFMDRQAAAAAEEKETSTRRNVVAITTGSGSGASAASSHLPNEPSGIVLN
jgi:hypothetical protein